MFRESKTIEQERRRHDGLMTLTLIAHQGANAVAIAPAGSSTHVVLEFLFVHTSSKHATARDKCFKISVTSEAVTSQYDSLRLDITCAASII